MDPSARGDREIVVGHEREIETLRTRGCEKQLAHGCLGNVVERNSSPIGVEDALPEDDESMADAS